MSLTTLALLGSVILIFTFIVLNLLYGTQLIPPLSKLPTTQNTPTSLFDLEPYLKTSEISIAPKPGTEKKIFFNTPPHRAKLSFVYLHGFTASRQEMSPVFERVATKQNASIFMTRFFGHGLGADELGRARVSDWIGDAVEALNVATTLGEQVVVTCMSTGCALGLYLAFYYPEKIKALILISPNFGPADPRSNLALGPFGKILTRILIGKYHEMKPNNGRQIYYWTNRFGSEVLTEMITLVNAVKKLNLAQIKIPTLTLYSPSDIIIDVTEIEKNVRRLSCPENEIVPIIETQEHILAGDIVNPVMNERIIDLCNAFLAKLKELPQSKSG